MDILNTGDSNYEKEITVKKLIRGLFMNLLFYYFGDEELPEFKKSDSDSFPPMIKVEYRYDFLKEKAKKVPLLSSLLNVLEAMSNISNGYKRKDVFEGNLTFIETEVERNNDWIDINIYCSIKHDYSETGNEENFLEIKVKTQTYRSYVNISVVFYKYSFYKDIYMKERNLDIFISDFGKFLTKLGIFSYHHSEFLFLAKYARVIQILS
ncbi:MAG: hypothetical protein KatS3mg101_1129 [Patescibacteria group bacterium]|nr:MAG: hypothetical protein KatS3mg101_1129 [Patescibacteria group bacterium]